MSRLVFFAEFIAAAATFIFFAVPEKPTQSQPAPFNQQWQEMLQILKLPLFWRAAPLLGISAGIPIAYQTLWAGLGFRDVAKFAPHDVARSLFWLAVAFMLGSLSFGMLADWLQRRGIGPMQTMAGLLLFHTAAQALLVLGNPEWGCVGWLTLAAVGQVAILSFPWFASQVGEGLSGRSNATINFAMFILAFISQFVVGYIISFFEPTATGYNPKGYRLAFGLFLVLQVIAFVWYALSMHRKPYSNVS